MKLSDHTRIVGAFFRRELTYRFLYKMDLYVFVVIPILNLLLYFLLGRFAGRFDYLGQSVDSVKFIIFSVILFYFSWDIMNSIISSVTEQKKVLMHYLETPASIYHVLSGSLAVGFLQASLFLLIEFTILSDLMTLPTSLVVYSYLLLYMAISLLSFVGISLAVAGLSFWIKRSELLFDITRLSLMIASGALFSPEIFPKVLLSLAYVFPPAVYIELSRSVILFSIYPSAGIIINYLLLSVAYLVAGTIIFSLLLRRARKTGRITLL